MYGEIVMAKKPPRVKLLVTAERSKLDKDSQTGNVYIYVNDVKVVELDYIIDQGHQITISSLNTEEDYRHCGFASIAMESIFGMARILRVPVYLYSAITAVKFYEKLGFRRVKKSWKCIEPDGDPSDDDMVWLPQGLYRRKHIKLHV
jgi:GNAT superfamily N-acetyltransferase